MLTFIAALLLFLVISKIPDEIMCSKWNPFIYAAALIMLPFIYFSERKLPKSQRTPFW